VLLPHFHGDDRFYYWRRYLEAFARADRTLLFSQGLAERLGPRGRFAVVPGGGVAGTELALPAAFARFREVLPDLEEPFFLVLGRKTGSKGYQRVVRAVQALRAAGEAVSVVLIGPDEDRVALGGLAGVHYLGRQPRETVLGALALCRGLVSMSVSESFGIVLCEAWKFRKPVVANRACASFRELVEDGVSGLLAETDTELLAAMRRLLDEPGLAERLGAAGFAAVTRRYSWEMAARAVARELTGAAETGRW
jgi:glycosyltransferase involved in cell wall biosynthesis